MCPKYRQARPVDTGAPGARLPRRRRAAIFAAVTPPVLTWLLLLPLIAIVAVPPTERPGAVTRVIVAAFGLGSLAVGAGELGLDTLTGYAAAGPGNALFVSLSAGIVLGAALPWRWRAWPSWAATLLLAITTAWPVAGSLHWGGYLLGAVLGALPLFLGRSLPTSGRGGAAATVSSPSSPLRGPDVGVLLLATLLAFAEPFALALLAPVVPIARSRWRRGTSTLPWRQLVLPGVALVAAVLLGWLALTIAGDPFVRLGGYFMAAPVSPAAERWLALLGLVMVVAMLAPWPLHRLGAGALLGPPAAILGWRMAGSLAPDMLGAWQPLVGLVLVPSAVVAAWRRHWSAALAAAATVVALHPDRPAMVAVALTLAAALAVVISGPDRNLTRPERVTFTGEWWVAMLAAAGLAASAGALLRHEVVLATLLAAGTASAAARTERSTPVA